MTRRLLLQSLTLLLIFAMLLVPASTLVAEDADRAVDDVDNEPKEAAVYCANLVYADNKTSICFSDEFLRVAAEETHIQTHESFDEVRLDSAELFDYPFAVMTGEGSFTMTQDQVRNLQDYLLGGGFLVASAGCSSQPWNRSFRNLMDEAFPDMRMTRLSAEHPIFHSVYDITKSRYKTGGPKLPHLEALEIDGRVVMIWSPDGLNDTANAGPSCCCCGGNEIKAARKLNVNILAYALTH